jgi:hypothetical protein
LVAIGDGIPGKSFVVLAGYSWNTKLAANGALVNPDPAPISNFNLVTLQKALDNSGFTKVNYDNKWIVRKDVALMLCPEPGTWVMKAMGGAVLFGVRRFRRAA